MAADDRRPRRTGVGRDAPGGLETGPRRACAWRRGFATARRTTCHDGAAAYWADKNTVAWFDGGSARHLHLDAEHASILVRTRGHPWRRACGLRRWRLDHDLADHGADAGLSDSDLDGYGIRPAKGVAGSRRGFRFYRADRGVLGQPAHAVDFAVPGRTCDGLLRAAHVELCAAEH